MHVYLNLLFAIAIASETPCKLRLTLFLRRSHIHFHFDCRNIPRAYIIGVVIVAVLYLLMNVALFVSLSYEEFASSQSVALVRL